jgi:hypothetical protein
MILMIQGVEADLGRRLTSCRVCKGKNLRAFLRLGFHPPSNEFLTGEEMSEPEVSFPLNAVLCGDCNFVQIDYAVKPELLFTPDYPYNSAVSDELPVHFADFARQVATDYVLDSSSLVVDIGGNDGTLLKGFAQCGTKVLNIEPTERIMKIARSRGIETVHAFWNEETAKKVFSEKGPAKAIVGTNVFAHIDDLDSFLAGVNVLLDKDGIFVIESPYLVELVENNEFDTIYHEHLSYLSIRPLKRMFARFGMEIVDVIMQNIHGGSMRVFVKKSAGKWDVKDSVRKFVEAEEDKGFDKFETYTEFAERVEKLRVNLISLLRDLKSQDKKIIGYGAAAKANTLLNYFKIGTDLIDYIVDKSQLKQGTYTPGMHIPVHGPDRIAQDKPDYVLILPWNFKDEIMRQQDQVRKWGGKFIVPIPKVEVV